MNRLSFRNKEIMAPILLVCASSIPFIVNLYTHTSPVSQGSETVYIWHPFQTFVNMAYSVGHFPLWSPHFFCGMSTIGFAHATAIYPFNFFVLPLKYTQAAIPHFFFHLTVLALGVYILFRALKTSTWISFIIALALMSLVKPYALIFLNSMTWLPYTIYFAVKFVTNDKGSLKHYLGIVGFSSLMMLGGEVEIFAYILIGGIISSLCVAITLRFQKTTLWRIFIIFFSVGSIFLICCPLIFGSAEYTFQSIRKFGFTSEYYVKVLHESTFIDIKIPRTIAISLFAGTFLIGVLAVLRRSILLISISLCLVIGIVVFSPSQFTDVLYRIPLLSLFRTPGRAIPVFVLWIAFVFAQVSQVIVKRLNRKLIFTAGFVACCAILPIRTLRWSEKPFNLFDYSPQYAAFFKSQKDLTRSISFCRYTFNYESYVIPPQSSALYNTQTIDGDTSIAPYYISRVLGTLDEDLLWFNNGKLDLNNIAYGLKNWGIIRDGNFRILSLLNLRYLVSESGIKTFEGPQLKKIYSDKDFSIYENVEAYPRVLIIHKISVKPEIEEALYLLSKAQGFDTRTMAIVSEVPLVPLAGKNISKTMVDEIKFVKYEFDNVKIFANLVQPGCLLLTDSYYPGWVASSNGTPLKIYRTDVAFRGLFLGSGAHDIIFIYKPVSFRIGLWSCLTSLFILLVLLLNVIRKKAPPAPSPLVADLR